MVNNSADANTLNNHLSPLSIQHKNTKNKTFKIQVLVGTGTTIWRVSPINEISTPYDNCTSNSNTDLSKYQQFTTDFSLIKISKQIDNLNFNQHLIYFAPNVITNSQTFDQITKEQYMIISIKCYTDQVIILCSSILFINPLCHIILL